MKLRLALVLAGALAAPVPAAYAGYGTGATCRGIAPVEPSCVSSFVATSGDLQVQHFRTVGRLTITVSSATGSWKITCGAVPSLITPDCNDDIRGGFLRGQLVTVRATSSGAGEYRVEVSTA